MQGMMSEVNAKLDSLCLDMLEILAAIDTKKREQEKHLQDGYLCLAKARYAIGVDRVSKLQYASEMHTRVTVECNADASDCFMLRQSNSTPEKTQPPIQDGTTVTRRHPPPLNDSDGRDGDVVDQQAKERPPTVMDPNDPLKWFGILVPHSLRLAQTSFIEGVKDSCEILNLEKKLEKVRFEYNEAMKLQSAFTFLSSGDAKLQVDDVSTESATSDEGSISSVIDATPLVKDTELSSDAAVPLPDAMYSDDAVSDVIATAGPTNTTSSGDGVATSSDEALTRDTAQSLTVGSENELQCDTSLLAEEPSSTTESGSLAGGVSSQMNDAILQSDDVTSSTDDVGAADSGSISTESASLSSDNIIVTDEEEEGDTLLRNNEYRPTVVTQSLVNQNGSKNVSSSTLDTTQYVTSSTDDASSLNNRVTSSSDVESQSTESATDDAVMSDEELSPPAGVTSSSRMN